MSKIDNILTESKELKEMPFSVPEGYFEGLESKVRGRLSLEGKAAQERRRFAIPMRIVPYLSAAAVLAVVVAFGLAFGLRGGKTVIPEDGLDDSDYVFYYTEVVPVTEPESIYYSYNFSSADDETTYEDIIEYLINSGIDVETLYNDLN